MAPNTATPLLLDPEVCSRAVGARDPRFDGLFFVGIVTTGVYCRPVCPSRTANDQNRRFFSTAAGAELAGFRPCLRCRPELAPGLAVIDAVPRLAQVAVRRIAAGALNGRGVPDLARDLGVSARHLRRALEREVGVSPVELAQTHRLLLAKHLLADTSLPVTRIAYASGFQSLRRFNTVFRERYRLSPTAVRRRIRSTDGTLDPPADGLSASPVSLTLAYREPMAWDILLDGLRGDALPGVESVSDSRYSRALRLGRCTGVVAVEPVPGKPQLRVTLSPGLLPVLMEVLARLRQVFDLDAEPEVVDAYLARTDLAPLVARHRGVRVPGALDGFDAALRLILVGSGAKVRVVQDLGEPIDSGVPALDRLAPSADQVADAGAPGLQALGMSRRRAETLSALARAVADGVLRLEPGRDVAPTRDALRSIPGVGEPLAAAILLRALHWPDAFAEGDPVLQRAAGAGGPRELLARAEQWRPWRGYAAQHLRLAAS
ncbi:MAG TPA: AlkA N-terminal domain-containing protein [Gemmatimonadales bacterium]|jgi:AraC family transcriptional regulator of adaptative response / DNA-3-methyladenine glycosylase II|nr:AlkA N-terminal domain-containing protein [Gemmatimonadales bacterium]